MSGADEAETGRPRVGPYLSSTGAENQDRATGSAAVNAETQMIPVLDTGPAVGPPKIERAGTSASRADVSTVRAIARRSAAALPALGEDGPRERPPSAKTAVQHRRQTQGRPSGGAVPIEVADPIVPAPMLGQRVPGEWLPAEPVPLIGQPKPVRARNSTPSSGTPLVAAPLPRRNADDSVVDTVIDGVPVPADGAAAVAPGSLDLGAQDGWVEPEPAGGPAAVDAVRPGPPVLELDSWDAAPGSDRDNAPYQGKRRQTVPWARVSLIVGLVAVVGALFAIPVALNSSSFPRAAGRSDDPFPTGDSAVLPGATNDAGELVSAASSPGSRVSPRATTSAAAGASAAPGPTASGVPTATATVTAQAVTQAQGSGQGAFSQVTLQAENAAMSASFWQLDLNSTCSAGTALVRLGKWYPYAPPGMVTFTVSVATAGSYQMRIYSVAALGSQTAQITVNGASVTTGAFPVGCLMPRDVSIALKSGSNQVQFTNTIGPGPSLDRIEISRP